MHIKWYGHAAFGLLPSQGPSVITDPYTPEGVGYAPIRDSADLVLISSDDDDAHCRTDRFLCRTPFSPGDLILFDNRRMLHGRAAFDPQSGVRRLEGCYLDRDEILSRLRVLARRHRSS